jgi:hypothetical protein
MKRWFLLLFAPLLAQACSSDEGASGGAPAGLSGYSEAYAAAYCKKSTECCKAAGKDSSETNCQNFFKAFGARSSSGNYDAASGEQCLKELESASCDTYLSITACDRAVTGNGKPGDSCSDNSDCGFPAEALRAGCVFRSTTDGNGSTSKKFCFVELAPEEGKPCNTDGPTNHLCDREHGFACEDKVCKKLPELGAECESFAGCTKGARCEANKCVALPGAGEDCNSFDGCADGLGCIKGKCGAKKAVGEACSDSAECPGSCNNGKCEASVWICFK